MSDDIAVRLLRITIAPALQSRLALTVQWLSLAAVAAVVWFWSVLPQLRYNPSNHLLGRAFAMSAMLWSWSALIGLLLLLVARLKDPEHAARRASLAVVWFAPATILASQLNPATIFPALVLAASTARLLFIEWRVQEQRSAQPQTAIPAMSIALVGQLGIVAFLMNRPLSGAAFAIMATAMLTVYSLETGATAVGSAPGLPRSSAGAILTVLLALGLTVGGSWGLLASGRGSNDRSQDMPPPPAPVATPSAMGGDFSGVILLSETQPIARLVEPKPYLGRGRLAPVDRRPFSIVFDGRYDIFRWPFHKPPSNSYTRRGSPVDLGFHTLDQRPLQMEAHQKLDIPLDVHCCSRIQLHIWNADTTPGRIWLELVLMDHDAAVSLGRAPVRSTPKIGQKIGEMLEFSLPPSIPLEEADELKVIFSRTMGRMERSVKVSIDRFLLEPR